MSTFMKRAKTNFCSVTILIYVHDAKSLRTLKNLMLTYVEL